MKKLLSLVLVMCILSNMIIALPINVSAATSGTCGKNLIWTLDGTGTLTISGTGEMYDWEDYADVPWYELCESIKKVVINNGVTNIGFGAFTYYENITEISIPSSLSEIQMFALFKCTGIEAFKVDADNNTYASDDGVLFNKDKTTIIKYPAGKWEYDYKLPDGVKEIGDEAFEGAMLHAITMSDSLTYIGDRAFYECSNLSYIENTKNIEYVGGEALFETKYSIDAKNRENGLLYLGNCLAEADRYAISEDVTIKEGTTSISPYAFQYCPVVEVYIPDSVVNIGGTAFGYCKALEQINLPDNLQTIGNAAFYFCSKLKNITIPDGITTINERIFQHCSNLTTITIPDSVTVVEWNAFFNCGSLKNVYYGGCEKEWGYISITSGNDSLLNANIHYNQTTKPKITALTVDSIGNVLVKAINIPDNINVYVGSYSEVGVLLEIQELTLKNGDASGTFDTTDVEKFKAFVWNDNKPLAKAKEYEM